MITEKQRTDILVATVRLTTKIALSLSKSGAFNHEPPEWQEQFTKDITQLQSFIGWLEVQIGNGS